MLRFTKVTEEYFMTFYRRNSMLNAAAIVTFVVLALSGAGVGQQLTRLQPVASLSSTIETGASEAAPVAAAAPLMNSFVISEGRSPRIEHPFWDRENGFLFAANAALSAADFVVTRDNLRGGGRELNPVTGLFAGSTAGLATNFTGEVVGVIGLSYVLHRTGHHKLERLVSVMNIGSSASAVSFDLAHR
jgi:hypothetical protein